MYEPYLTLRDEYRDGLTAAARRNGYHSNAPYMRSLIYEGIREDAPDKLPDHLIDEAEPDP